MEDKLRAYMDEVFAGVKKTRKAVELKEEILQNILDKYHDLLEEGKSPEAAYNIAIASLGDMDEILRVLEKETQDYQYVPSEEISAAKKKSALLMSIAIGLYILLAVPVTLAGMTGQYMELGVALLFICVALATGLLIYNNMTKPRFHKEDETLLNEFREWKADKDSRNSSRKAVTSAMWALITAFYFLISFMTMAWHITWIIFLIGAALEAIIRAVYEIRR